MPTVFDPATDQTRTETPHGPLILWHLLSLDAPTVAALWTWFIARVFQVPVPNASIAAMFLAVWILYAADRLLDARHVDAGILERRAACVGPMDEVAPLEARHLFHLRHRHLFRVGILLASLALAPLLSLIPAEAIRLYLIAGSLLFGWFVLIHIAPARSVHRLPKELAVGAFFAAATFIPTVARAPALRLSLLVPAILFGALCSLNCLFIYAWEHPSPGHQNCHASTRVALTHLPLLAVVLSLASLGAAAFDRRASPLLLATATSMAILFALHRTRPWPMLHDAANLPPIPGVRTGPAPRIGSPGIKLSRTALRVAGDLALLTPLFFLFL